MKTVANALFAVALSLGLSGFSQADTQPSGKKDILYALEDIGCKVTESHDGKNSKVHRAEFTQGGKKYYLRVSLSADNSRVWIGLPLVKMDPSLAAGNADRLYKLLERNQDIGPSHFKILEDKLFLSGSIENRDATNFKIRELIDTLIDCCESTRKDWDFEWNKSTGTTGATTLGRAR